MTGLIVLALAKGGERTALRRSDVPPETGRGRDFRFWAFVFTYAMLRIIDGFTPVKVDELSEALGLDESIHGEHAYEEVPEHDLIHAGIR